MGSVREELEDWESRNEWMESYFKSKGLIPKDAVNVRFRKVQDPAPKKSVIQKMIEHNKVKKK